MGNKQTTINSKLFKLKEWLTVPEAAKHLSTIFGEEMSEADILRLALDGHLKLSVYFVNHATARRGKVVSYEEAEWYSTKSISMFNSLLPDKFKKNEIKEHCIMKSLNIDDHRYLNLEDEVITIRGVWDLSMVGSERLDVEHKYQNLTDGPEVILQGLDGAFVENEGGVMCQLQESFDNNEHQRGSNAQLEKIEERIASNNIGEEQAKKLLDQHKKDREEYLNAREKKDNSADYYPAGGLPRDSVIVVRTQALIDLQDRLSQDSSRKNVPLDSRSETTYLNIIGAMLETFVHRSHGEIDFPSEAKLREFFSQKYAGFKGLTERTLAEKFSAAKKAINEEFD
ncbi:hypothetical protein ACFL0M_00325 [Thermodesulfobacteriota bacterium]